MEKIRKTSARIIVFVLGFVVVSKIAFAQVAANEDIASTPWYKIPWLWIGILMILGAIIVYITFAKSK